MKKSTIQTSLLNLRVRHNERFRDQCPKDGVIRSVYMDQEGNPKYTVVCEETGKLFDCYSHAFVVKIDQEHGV